MTLEERKYFTQGLVLGALIATSTIIGVVAMAFWLV